MSLSSEVRQVVDGHSIAQLIHGKNFLPYFVAGAPEIIRASKTAIRAVPFPAGLTPCRKPVMQYASANALRYKAPSIEPAWLLLLLAFFLFPDEFLYTTIHDMQISII
jgi:hypothetical protein